MKIGNNNGQATHGARKHAWRTQAAWANFCSQMFKTKISSDFDLVNKTLPWDYNFRFVIEEINNINDKSQVSNAGFII